MVQPCQSMGTAEGFMVGRAAAEPYIRVAGHGFNSGRRRALQRVTTTDKHACEECVRLGNTWVDLRLCLSCGQR